MTRQQACRWKVLAAIIGALLAGGLRADIYEWEYIDPDDPSQGKQESTVLLSTAVPAPGINLLYSNFTKAYLAGAPLERAIFTDTNLTDAYLAFANLSNASFSDTNLTGADLSSANHRGAALLSATLTDADFSDANIYAAYLSHQGASYALKMTQAQFYSTASYQSHNLGPLGLRGANVTWWDLSNQNLREATFISGIVDESDLSGADLYGARFDDSSLQRADLCDTNLTNAHLNGANLTGG